MDLVRDIADRHDALRESAASPTGLVRLAAERSGLRVSSIGMDDGGLWVRCGPHVPPFTGATVAEVVAKIDGYNCKHCGSGGSHTPNCGRPR